MAERRSTMSTEVTGTTPTRTPDSEQGLLLLVLTLVVLGVAGMFLISA
jgi:hypothetical protein